MKPAILFLALAPAFAQSFEAASIKPSPPDARGMGISTFPNRIHVTNSPLKFLVEVAFDVKDYQVAGGATWMDNERFNIDATAAAAFAKGEFRTMLRTLLVDRFGLLIHHETRDRPGYALVVAKNGPKLPPHGESPDLMFGRTPNGDTSLTAENASTEDLASLLSSVLRTPIVNETAIPGKFNVSMEFAPESSGQVQLSKPGAILPPPPPDAVPGPSVFTAIQEKLGLKLATKKIPVEVIVIDQAHRPTEN
jgi:uncharacterized protein (TIGR03435 family)